MKDTTTGPGLSQRLTLMSTKYSESWSASITIKQLNWRQACQEKRRAPSRRSLLRVPYSIKNEIGRQCEIRADEQCSQFLARLALRNKTGLAERKILPGYAHAYKVPI